MISESSISTLVAWRRETVSRLGKVRKVEDLFRETFKSSANALKQAKYKGRDVSWDDRVAILSMCEDIITWVTRMMHTRSEDLEQLLDSIDKLAKAEMPPGVSWEWPAANSESQEH
jgi:hypothetical protein